jgi:hypothetical protein
MCFSPEISLITFIIGIVGAYLSFSLNTPSDKIIGLFFGFVSLMQGIEFILWKNKTCNETNKTFTSLGLILNHLQPIILFILILLLNKNLSYQKKNIIYLCVIIYSIVIILYSSQFKLQNECTSKNKSNHLDWNWNNLSYKYIAYGVFLITLFMLFLVGIPNEKYGIILSLITVLSYIFSFFIYKNKNVIGSLWCFFSSLFPIFWFIIRKFNVL